MRDVIECTDSNVSAFVGRERRYTTGILILLMESSSKSCEGTTLSLESPSDVMATC